MLGKRKDDAGKARGLSETSGEPQKGFLEELMSGYSKLTIDDPLIPFKEQNLDEVTNNVDYGVLKALDGTWVSYNADYNGNIERKLNGSGIHTTIMPSPGTNPGTIPGKFSFECEEYTGGTTSWPHIQVNTLRKLEDIPADQRCIIEEQFPD